MGRIKQDVQPDEYDVNGVILPMDEHPCQPDNINQDFAHYGANPDQLNKDSEPASGGM